MDTLDQMASALGITTSELNTTYMTLQRLVNYNQVGSGTQLNPKVVAGIGIPPVSGLRAINLGALTGSSRIIVAWNEPTLAAIHGYNVFYSTVKSGSAPSGPGTMIASTLHSPAIITVPPTTDPVISILVQTVAQSGSALDFALCPSTTVSASSPNIVTSDLILTQIVNGSPPIFLNVTWTNHSPSSTYIAWSAATISLNGVVYPITSGNTNQNIIYWDSTSPNVFSASSLPFYPTATQYLIATNQGGVHLDITGNSIFYSTVGSNNWSVLAPSGTTTGDNTNTLSFLSQIGLSFINSASVTNAQISGNDGSFGGYLGLFSADGTSNSVQAKGSTGTIFGTGAGSTCSFPTLDGSGANIGLSLSNCTIFGTVGALAGYIVIKVNGTFYKIPIYNQV